MKRHLVPFHASYQFAIPQATNSPALSPLSGQTSAPFVATLLVSMNVDGRRRKQKALQNHHVSKSEGFMAASKSVKSKVNVEPDIPNLDEPAQVTTKAPKARPRKTTISPEPKQATLVSPKGPEKRPVPKPAPVRKAKVPSEALVETEVEPKSAEPRVVTAQDVPEAAKPIRRKTTTQKPGTSQNQEQQTEEKRTPAKPKKASPRKAVARSGHSKSVRDAAPSQGTAPEPAISDVAVSATSQPHDVEANTDEQASIYSKHEAELEELRKRLVEADKRAFSSTPPLSKEDNHALKLGRKLSALKGWQRWLMDWLLS
jgi:hypothetical protein